MTHPHERAPQNMMSERVEMLKSKGIQSKFRRLFIASLRQTYAR